MVDRLNYMMKKWDLPWLVTGDDHELPILDVNRNNRGGFKIELDKGVVLPHVTNENLLGLTIRIQDLVNLTGKKLRFYTNLDVEGRLAGFKHGVQYQNQIRNLQYVVDSMESQIENLHEFKLHPVLGGEYLDEMEDLVKRSRGLLDEARGRNKRGGGLYDNYVYGGVEYDIPE